MNEPITLDKSEIRELADRMAKAGSTFECPHIARGLAEKGLILSAIASSMEGGEFVLLSDLNAAIA